MTDSRLLFWLRVILFLVCALQAGKALVTPPGIVYDARMGFLVLKSMQGGADFNSYFNADFTDINKDVQVFESTWAPGQYLVPALFQAAGLDLGRSAQITSLLFALLGLGGVYALCLFLGFDRLVATLACLVIASGRWFSSFFWGYTGGEVLLFGIVAWAIVLAARLDPTDIRGALLLFAVLLCGAVIKHTFLVCMIALYPGLLALRIWPGGADKGPFLRYAAAVTAIWVGVFALDYLIFIQHRPDPLYRPHWEAAGDYRLLAFIIGAPLSEALSLEALMSRLAAFPVFPWIYENLYLSFSLCLNVAVLVMSLRRHPDPRYRTIGLIFLVIYSLCLYWLYMTTGLSRETRHFRSAGLVLLPAFIFLMLPLRRSFAGAALLVSLLAASSAFGLRLLWVDRGELLERSGRNGLVLNYTQADYALLSRLQTCPGSTLFYIQDPGLALALDSRYLLDRYLGSNAPIHGRVDNLFVALGAEDPGQTDRPGVGEQQILDRFVDYRGASWKRFTGANLQVYARSTCDPDS